jgi:uncharacterized protein (DUF952 family)
MAEGYDWTQVQSGPCPRCALDPTATRLDRLAPAVNEAAASWGRWLLGESAPPDALGAVRTRPDESTWSALEYACHVRDLLTIFDARLALVLIEDEPDVGWWDHEATARDERYNEQDPTLVAVRIIANAAALAERIEPLHADEWNRLSTRRGTEEFTVSGMARFCLHEVHHHLRDAQRSAGALGGVVHVAPADAWEASATAQWYQPSDLAQTGFVHCCAPDQVDGVLERWFPGRTDLVIVELDPYMLTSELRWNESQPGEWFLHLHGPVNVGAVTATRSLV